MPATGTVSWATGVISMVLLSAMVVLGILLDRRVRLPGRPRFAGLSLGQQFGAQAVSGAGNRVDLQPQRGKALIALDHWGYPLPKDEPIPLSLVRRARRAVTDCPALALGLTDASSVKAATDPERVQP